MQRLNQHWSHRHEHTLNKWQSHDDKEPENIWILIQSSGDSE